MGLVVAVILIIIVGLAIWYFVSQDDGDTSPVSPSPSASAVSSSPLASP
jgi:hypothetical protein